MFYDQFSNYQPHRQVMNEYFYYIIIITPLNSKIKHICNWNLYKLPLYVKQKL